MIREPNLVQRSIQKVRKKCLRFISSRWATTKRMLGIVNEFLLTPCLFVFGV